MLVFLREAVIDLPYIYEMNCHIGVLKVAKTEHLPVTNHHKGGDSSS